MMNQYSNASQQQPFPVQLHKLLEIVEQNGAEDIVSWLPCGTMFRVHKREEFSKTIMKQFFRQTVFKSFLRQLNMWGFIRVLSGPGKGAYRHDYFRREVPQLCLSMVRGAVQDSPTMIRQEGKLKSEELSHNTYNPLKDWVKARKHSVEDCSGLNVSPVAGSLFDNQWPIQQRPKPTNIVPEQNHNVARSLNVSSSLSFEPRSIEAMVSDTFSPLHDLYNDWDMCQLLQSTNSEIFPYDL